MRQRLPEKVAVVTGASKGIGASIARHFAEEGATVVVNYASDREGAERVVEEIVGNGGKATALQANLTDENAIKTLFRDIEKRFGRVDILVNNAGVYAFKGIDEFDTEHYHEMFDINVLGLLLVTKEALPLFPEGGGSVINISSIASRRCRPTAAVYSGTKAAVDAITVSLSKELGPRGIRVNALNPGLIVTEGVDRVGILKSAFHKEVEEKTPLQRVGVPEDVAKVAVFLASDEARWVTGEQIKVAGGFA